jgi:ElaB/YqjD/DUF883 family membrane-anchored ribosome-binding protein
MAGTPSAGVPTAGVPAGVQTPLREGFSMSVSNNLEAAANAVVEDLANDVKGVLSNKDLESVPQIKALKQRVEAKLAIARELASEKSKVAAKKAKDAAQTANAYAHDEPWQIAGAALAVGVLVGLLLGSRR